MALQLEQDHKGIAANYWRINYFAYNDVKDEAVVHLWLYASKEARDQNLSQNCLTREVLTVKNVKSEYIPILEQPMPARDILKAMLYNKITASVKDKEGNELNKFAEAVSV